jgi:hypothetical protein
MILDDPIEQWRPGSASATLDRTQGSSSPTVPGLVVSGRPPPVGRPTGMNKTDPVTYPVDFTVPVDSGGPGAGSPLGGFGGNPQTDRDAHRTVVADLGRAPVLLVHGNGGAADVRPWDLLDQKRFLLAAGYADEIIWAPSYLGPGTVDLQTPHTNNVDDVRSYLEAVCGYLGVDVVDVIAHSLGCSMVYSSARGLKRQNAPIVWDQPKRWHRIGTFVALAGAFHGLGTGSIGEWRSGGEFMTELLAETEGGGGETPFGAGDPPTEGTQPHTITYFCGTAAGDFVDAQNPGTGRLDGAVNRSYNLGSGTQGHQAIKENQAVFDEFLPLLNSTPPTPPVVLVLQPASGAQQPGVAVTVQVNPDRDVSVIAERVVTEFANGYLIRTVRDTVTGTVRHGGSVTLADPGVWEVTANAVGAVPQRATYWVGVLPVEVTVVTDNDQPFENTLLVTAIASSQVATIYHSLDAEHWTPGASVTINQDAVVSFVAIDPNGVASTVASRSFTKRIPWDDQVTGSVIDHFVAGRIDVDEFIAYSSQFGFFASFTLYLVGGDWVLDPTRPAAPVSGAPATPTGDRRPTLVSIPTEPPGSEVRYTLDGTPPTDASPALTGDAVDLPPGDAPVVVAYRITDRDGRVRYAASPIPGR